MWGQTNLLGTRFGSVCLVISKFRSWPRKNENHPGLAFRPACQGRNKIPQNRNKFPRFRRFENSPASALLFDRRELAREALDKGIHPSGFLLRCLEQKCETRHERRLVSRLRAAKFPFDLVICDELGYLKLGAGAPLFFQLMADRYETGSLIVTSNLEFSRWQEVFEDAALTTALLDRLTHRAHILVFKGESHRFRDSQRHARKGGD